MKIPDFIHLRVPLVSIESVICALRLDNWHEMTKEPDFQHAIRLASETLFQQLLDPASKSDPKIQQALLKYLLRSSTRCTPFGLFAGCSVGTVGNDSVFDFRLSSLRPNVNLDWNVISALLQNLSEDDNLRPQLLFYPNNTIWAVGSRLRYTEFDFSAKQYFSTQVPKEIHIEKALELAKNGKTIGSLAASFVNHPITLNDATAFIEQLIQDGILVSELMVSPVGKNPLWTLTKTMQRWKGTQQKREDLLALNAVLKDFFSDQKSFENLSHILSCRFGLKKLPRDVVHCDTFFKNQIVTLGKKPLLAISSAIRKLMVLNRVDNTELQGFKEQFYDRYQEQEIPLLSAMDECSGVGYTYAQTENTESYSFLDDRAVDKGKNNQPGPDQRLEKLKVNLYTNWKIESSGTVEITEKDLQDIGAADNLPPASFFVHGFMVASSAAQIDQGQFHFVLKAAAGPSAFQMMARFCGGDTQLDDWVQARLRGIQDADPEKIYAEVSHLPTPRSGNVIQRPHLRKYEIPYLVHSSLPIQQQITLQDLMVSVPGGKKVMIRSKSLNKQVIPCLTTAFNYQQGLSVYRFLGDVQHQHGELNLGWDWGNLESAKRLPRVQFRQIILKEAQWNLTDADIDKSMADRDNVALLQKKWEMPRYIALVQLDQQLFLDLQTDVCASLFVSTLLRVRHIRVVEWLQTPENCFVEGSTGKLTHEMVIPFEVPSPKQKHQAMPLFNAETVQRDFIPGSAWLYYKLYCHPRIADEIIILVATNFAKARALLQIEKWHFVRYQDPDFHVRIRFNFSQTRAFPDVVAWFNHLVLPFLESKEIRKVQLETYERELERYSPGLIEQTESLFHCHSQMVSLLLQCCRQDHTTLSTGLLSIDALLRSFSMDIQGRFHFYKTNFEAHFYCRELPASSLKQMSAKYRENRDLVSRVLFTNELTASEADIAGIIEQHTCSLQLQIESILEFAVQNESFCLADYLGSIIHMLINKLFDKEHSSVEIHLYYYLQKSFDSFLSAEAAQRVKKQESLSLAEGQFI